MRPLALPDLRARPRVCALLGAAALACGLGTPAASASSPSREVVVALRAGGTERVAVGPRGSVTATLARLRARPGVRWARPRVTAHAAALEPFVPDDPGDGAVAGGWQQLQWNFLPGVGIDAPRAWANLRAAGHPGGKGVIIAALDTGAAYADRGDMERSPDFTAGQFVKGYDFCSHDGVELACRGRDQYPEDRNGHGTHVTGTLAEATNNGVGLTGLAYGARIMPVKVLNSEGEGDEASIASGIRFAVEHGAQIINMSLEFESSVRADDIPDILSALRFARRRGILVVGAAGNEGITSVAYPARDPSVLSVGATTEHGCQSIYSNRGTDLDLVAPGGGADATIPPEAQCQPDGKAGRNIFQLTYRGPKDHRFGFPSDYEGTSMAAPQVSATAALIVASGLLGPHPTRGALVRRLKATARDLGAPGPDDRYGAGLIDAGAATDPTVPTVIAKP